MSLVVALQSVLYYFAACSPCRQCAYRRRRKREAAISKRRQGEIEAGEPGLYRHPSPFSTNIYWREELALGPGPPPKKGSRNDKGSSQRRLITAGPGSSMGSSAASQGDVLSVIGTQLPADSQDWYLKRYQREDEILWGRDGRLDSDGRRPSTVVGSSVGVTGISGSGTTLPESYYAARNPPVNELHPPIVSTQPTKRSESRWMLQPPPSAKVMNGKATSNRDRSDSGGSGLRSVADCSLGRQLSRKLIEEKRGQTEHDNHRAEPIATSRTGSQRVLRDSGVMDGGQQHWLSNRRLEQPSAILIDTAPEMSAETPQPGPLSINTSEDGAGGTQQQDPEPASLDRVSTPSLQVLQELVAPDSLLITPSSSTALFGWSQSSPDLPSISADQAEDHDRSASRSSTPCPARRRGHLNRDFKFPDPNNVSMARDADDDNDDDDRDSADGHDSDAEQEHEREMESYYDAMSHRSSLSTSSETERRAGRAAGRRRSRGRGRSSSTRRRRPPE